MSMDTLHTPGPLSLETLDVWDLFHLAEAVKPYWLTVKTARKNYEDEWNAPIRIGQEYFSIQRSGAWGDVDRYSESSMLVILRRLFANPAALAFAHETYLNNFKVLRNVVDNMFDGLDLNPKDGL